MVIPSYCSKFHLAVSWVVFLPLEEESLAPPALLVTTGANEMPADPEQRQRHGHLCDGLVNYPKEVGLPRQPGGALEIILLSVLNCKQIKNRYKDIVVVKDKRRKKSVSSHFTAGERTIVKSCNCPKNQSPAAVTGGN